MPIISNLTDRPVLLAFNSGQTLRLSPRSISQDIPDVEIVNNSKVAKLTAQNIIAIEEPQQKRRPAGASAERTPAGASEAPAAPARAETSSRAEASGKATAPARSEKPAKRS